VGWVANTQRPGRVERDITPAKDWDLSYTEVDRWSRESLFYLLNV
jgi:hypothetical protein